MLVDESQSTLVVYSRIDAGATGRGSLPKPFVYIFSIRILKNLFNLILLSSDELHYSDASHQVNECALVQGL